MSILRKFGFPALSLIFAVWLFSILFAVGIIFGYAATHLSHKRITRNPRLKMIYFSIKNFRIHFHHWLMGVLFLIFCWIGGFLNLLPYFFWGLVTGFIFHDLHLDKNWYKVIQKNI